MISFESIDMTKYQAAVQRPARAFSDPALSGKRVMKNSLGWPEARSGNFAIVYRLVGAERTTHREETIAVRCFKKLAPDLAQRYERICKALDRAALASKFLLRTKYLAQGIRIDSGWKPVTTLPWIDGVPLDRYLDTIHSQRHLMERIKGQFREMARDLEVAGIAHGDLQHRNILIDKSGTMRLIDYDGIFVESLRGWQATEYGHPDYQHPGRDDPAMFGLWLDRFSLIAIYLQLSAIAGHPELWTQKERTEGLLLRRSDFLDHDTSPTLAALRSFDDLRAGVDVFRRLCIGPIGDVPSLNAFFDESGLGPRPLNRASRGAVDPISRVTVPAVTAPPTLHMPVIRPDLTALLRFTGDEVMVIGRWSHTQTAKVTDGPAPASIHLETGNNRYSFSILVEGSVAKHYRSLGDRWKINRRQDWISATGLLVRQGTQFIIQVEQVAQIELLKDVEAQRRFAEGRRGGPAKHPPNPSQPPVPRGEAPRVKRSQRVDESGTRDAAASDRRLRITRRGRELVAKDFKQLGEIFRQRNSEEA